MTKLRPKKTRKVARRKVAEYRAARGPVNPGEEVSTLQINFPREASMGEWLLRGTPEFLSQTREGIMLAVGQIASGFGVPRPIVQAIATELREAHEALCRNESFEGQFVFVVKWRHLE